MKEKSLPHRYELDPKTIRDVRDEIEHYDVYRLTREIGHFAEQQPEVVVFVAQLLRQQGDIADRGVFLSYSIFRIMDSLFLSGIPLIPMAALERKLEENHQWLEQLGKMERKLLERRLRYSEEFSQPFLIRFLLDELGVRADMHELSSEETGLLFLLGKTLSDALMDCLPEGRR